MPYDPDPHNFDQTINAPIIEYLGCQPARNKKAVFAIISIRFAPATTFASRTYALTQAQVIRLRDDLDALLTTPGSWLLAEEKEGA